jgi:heme/copper-type cytochrome/quinol oxidase subunit 2
VSSIGRGNHGWITFLVGLIVAALAALRAPRLSALATGVAGLLALSVAVQSWTAMRRIIEHAENVQPAPVHGTIGIGLWLTVFSAITIVGLSIAWTTMEYGMRRPARRHRRASV